MNTTGLTIRLMVSLFGTMHAQGIAEGNREGWSEEKRIDRAE